MIPLLFAVATLSWGYTPGTTYQACYRVPSAVMTEWNCTTPNGAAHHVFSLAPGVYDFAIKANGELSHVTRTTLTGLDAERVRDYRERLVSCQASYRKLRERCK